MQRVSASSNSAEDEDSGFDFVVPAWTQTGAIVALTGGTKIVDERLEKMWEAGVPLSGVWFQDWSGLEPTSFGERVKWDWKLDEEHYSGFEAFRQKWADRGVKLLTYLNPNLKTREQPYAAWAGEEGNSVSAAPGASKKPSSTSSSTMYEEAKSLGYLLTLNTNPGEPFVFPSATDDFLFAQLDLARPEVREWFAHAVVVCRGMMVRHEKYCPELKNDREPSVHGYKIFQKTSHASTNSVFVIIV